MELNGPCIFYTQAINLVAHSQISPFLYSRTAEVTDGGRRMRGKRNNKGVKNKSVTIPNEPLISKTSQYKSEPEAGLNIRNCGCVFVTVALQRRRFQHHTALQVKTPQGSRMDDKEEEAFIAASKNEHTDLKLQPKV